MKTLRIIFVIFIGLCQINAYTKSIFTNKRKALLYKENKAIQLNNETQTSTFIKVFPNPLQSPFQLNLALKQVAYGTYNLKVVDVFGNIIWIQEEEVFEPYRILSYDLSSRLNGFYSSVLLFLIIEYKLNQEFTTIPLVIL